MAYQNRIIVRKRPVYAAKTKIKTGLYTEGKEYMFPDTLKEYVGLYHTYPNGAVYSGASFSKKYSNVLVPYSIATEPATLVDEKGAMTESTGSLNNSIYLRITGTRFNQYRKPQFYYPIVTEKDYKRGSIMRHFAQHVSNPGNITEITEEEFIRINTDNRRGIDQDVHFYIKIPWSITGPLQLCRERNAANTLAAEDIFPGILDYLSDPDEFHKERHARKESDYNDQLYTQGGEYTLPDGTPYVGEYHINPISGPMVGAKHSDTPHDKLYLIPGVDVGRQMEGFYTGGGEYIKSNGLPYVGYYHLHPEKGAMAGAKHTPNPHERIYPVRDKEKLGIVGGFGGGAY